MTRRTRSRFALAAVLAFLMLVVSRDLHAAPPTITPAEVNALIAKLGDPDFMVRDAAEAELFARGKESLDNALLIEKRLQETIKMPGVDPEIQLRSGHIVDKLVALGLRSIVINDGTEAVTATSDGYDDNKVTVDAPPGKLEIVVLRDAFFRNFIGPTKIVYFLEGGAVPDKNGLVQLSDQIFFGVLNDGTFGLTFESDGENDPLGRGDCTADDVVCIQETGGPQEVAKLIFGDKAGWMSIKVTSDAETPEPATVTLVGLGLATLGGYASRRRRVT